MKAFRVVMAVLLVFALASGALAMTPEEENEAWKKEPAYGRTIRIGYSGAFCTGTLGLATYMGFYEKEGIKTEAVKYQGDTVDLCNALGTGRLDISGGHIATLLVPAINGVQIMFTDGMHTGCKSLCVLADSPYKTTKDLVGKTIGFPSSIGGSDHNITMRFLIRDGIDPVRDVKYKATDQGAAVLAMQNGELAAGLFSDQFIQKFLKDGTLRIIRSITFDDDFKDETCCIYAIGRDFYEKNPITVKKLTRAHAATRKWLSENTEEAVKVLFENNWGSGTQEAALEYLKTLNYDITTESTEETLRKVINDYKTLGILNKSLDTDEALKHVWAPVLTEVF